MRKNTGRLLLSVRLSAGYGFRILASLFLLPLWLLFVLEPDLLPSKLQFIGPNEATNIPTVVQIFLADFGIEFLRMAAIHTPTPLATAMGLIAAALIGQIAIDVGLLFPRLFCMWLLQQLVHSRRQAMS